MAYLFRSGLFMLSLFSLSMISCEQVEDVGTMVSMRAISMEHAAAHAPDLGTAAEVQPVTHEVLQSWRSAVIRIEDGQAVPCQCNPADFDIQQIFLKPDILSDKHSFLYQNGQLTHAQHVFTGEDVIGIDMYYQGQYVRMSDIPVFEQKSDSDYPYSREKGVGVFYNASTGIQAVAYTFPIGSSEDQPNVSQTSLWMRIVLDFH